MLKGYRVIIPRETIVYLFFVFIVLASPIVQRKCL